MRKSVLSLSGLMSNEMGCDVRGDNAFIFKIHSLTNMKILYAEDTAVKTIMGCCKLARVDVNKWLSHFFIHVHDYDQDYSCGQLEPIPHNLKHKGVL